MADPGYPVLTSLIFFPLIAAAFMGFFMKQGPAARLFTFGVSVFEIILALPLLGFDLADPGFQFRETAVWLPQLGLAYDLGVDGISLLMVMLTVGILPLLVLCSWTYIGKRVKEFHFCLLLMTSACIGVFSALDFVLFYVFWEAMLVPMYLLIAVWGGPERRYASIKFFLYTLAGSTLLLVAMIAFYTVGGTFSIPELMTKAYSFKFQFWTFLAMTLAFAIKVPMFPFHTWLPAAHVQAPAAGSVILASVLLKMGTYGFLRFCLPLTPAASEYFAPLMIAVSVASILYGGLVALGQNDIKKLIAYSSVGHMGFATLGIFMFNLRGLEGCLLVMLNHGITTGGLFMMIGLVYERSHSREMDDNKGLGKYMPAFMFFWGLLALSSFGFPGLNSFVGEAAVLIGVFQNSYLVGALIIPGAMLAAAYMLRLSLRMAWGQPSSAKGKGARGSWKDLSVREWGYMIPVAVFVIWLGLAPGIVLRTIDPALTKLLEDYNTRRQMVVTEVQEPAAEQAMAVLEPAGMDRANHP